MSATNRGSVRHERDLYETPFWLTRAVLPLLKQRLIATDAWPPRVYEPACGNLAIVRELKLAWADADIMYSDIAAPYSLDFLQTPVTSTYDLIITNPPFKLAQQFCEQAKLWRRRPNSLICMLLRINFLGAKKRAKWMRDNLPSISVSPRRPSFGLNKEGRPGTDATEYAWFIWPAAEPHISILETEDKLVTY